ncbi:hypothetical protein A1QC_12285 [Vibrio rumoiensis 1S-45]|uniref:OmpA-like domain-containing protein n=1 Tax=Vibrio rumoiensis 1S-45 TaxID=1188252 RepID=A0A1E5E098_9VIBR|nr:hypothetical protein A1QC_12285 [Vibrio rumoiensis 1S-45]
MKQVSLLTSVASIVSLSLLFSGQANAAAENAGEFYLGAKTGWSNFVECSSTDCDDDAWAGSLYGGYQFNSWLSLEGGYNYLGKSKSYVSDVLANETRVNQGELGLKMDWNLTDTWNLFAKVGGSYNDVDSTATEDDENFSYMAGAGIEYQINHNWRLRSEYQWFNHVGERSTTGNTDINYLSFGISYYFGSPAPVAAAAVAAPVVAQEVAPEPAPEPLPAATLSTNAFTLNSTELTDTAKGSLDPVATYLEQHPDVTVDVVGYTDSSGAAEYNQQLSEKRAQSAADYLTAQGVETSRITVDGKGEENPIADNATREGREKNRRIEVYYKMN